MNTKRRIANVADLEQAPRDAQRHAGFKRDHGLGSALHHHSSPHLEDVPNFTDGAMFDGGLPPSAQARTPPNSSVRSQGAR